MGRSTRKTCPKGMIRRAGTRKCVRGIGPLKSGDLKRFGYGNVVSMSEGARRAALRRAVAVYGSLTVFRKLNAVAIYTRRTAPASSAIFKADRDWVRRSAWHS